MSIHYSRFGLNTYKDMPYFRAHVPPDYPLDRVLQSARAYRRLPPRLRELAVRAKEWALKHVKTSLDTAGIGDIDRWYDAKGNELNPTTGQPLTDAQIDEQWQGQPPGGDVPDIPEPPNGFADPATWMPPAPTPEPVPEGKPSREELLRDIATHGREAVAQEYNIPLEQLPEGNA